MSMRKVAVVGAGMTKFVRRALEDVRWAHGLGKRAREFVATQQGATLRTIKLLEPLVERPSGAGKSAAA